MDTDLSQLLDESIKLELNVAELYTIFYRTFQEHVNFWWKLVLEEKNHASLIRSGKEHFEPVHKLPADLLSSNLRELKDANAKIVSLIKECRSNPPSMEEAFNIALELELSAGEIHYQNFMKKEEGSEVTRIFQQLNKDDKDHAMRLRSYMNKHGIGIKNTGVAR